MHEAERVFRDRMVNDADMSKVRGMNAASTPLSLINPSPRMAQRLPLAPPHPFPSLPPSPLKFDEFRFAVTKKYFDDCGGMAAVEERPLLYCSFLQV